MRIFEKRLALDCLAEGMTAVTLSTDAVHALGGELLQGMKVTLMGALPDGRVAELASDIEVLSANTASVTSAGSLAETGNDAGSNKGNGRASLLGGSTQSFGNGGDIHWVTLAIPEEQVSQILAAANANTVHLVLPKADEGESEN
jgi:hypothetical protein